MPRRSIYKHAGITVKVMKEKEEKEQRNPQSALNPVPSFSYLIVTSFTYHKQKTGMNFIH